MQPSNKAFTPVAPPSIQLTTPPLELSLSKLIPEQGELCPNNLYKHRFLEKYKNSIFINTWVCVVCVGQQNTQINKYRGLPTDGTEPEELWRNTNRRDPISLVNKVYAHTVTSLW